MTGQQLQINPNNAIYASDEYGRPFIIVREQEKKQRMHGIEAQKVTCRSIDSLGTHHGCSLSL